MATYADAKTAKELIYDVANLNNSLIAGLARVMAIRASFLALNAAQRDVIRAAINDQGFSATEIEAIVAKWAAVDAEKNTQGLVTVAQP